MSLSVNYPSPVQVNGYACNNCTEVDEAKKHIDPAHPKDGPFGIDAPKDSKAGASPAVTFGGALAGLSQAGGIPTPSATGSRLDVSV
jgi:hypothetical protein